MQPILYHLGGRQMAEYGETAPYGELDYKQDRGESDNRHFKIMVAEFPNKDLIEDDDE